MWTRRRLAIVTALGLVALLAIAHFAAPARTNPPVDQSLRLEATSAAPPGVLATLQRSCYDCHSNETRWPLYSRVPPTSWLVARDVVEGRGHLNFSRWGEYNPFDRADLLDEACDLASSGKMPLWPYLLMHRDARLTEADIRALCAWTREEAARLTSASP